MEDDEVVLSDVHIITGDHLLTGVVSYECQNATLNIKVATSRFQFKFHLDGGEGTSGEKNDTCADIVVDQDGDFDVPRRNSAGVSHEVITVEHGIATPLPLVGLQVWLGSLLLSDYILYLRNSFIGSSVLELGAGTGLCSIVVSLFAKQVICTVWANIRESIEWCPCGSNSMEFDLKASIVNDIGPSVMSLCQKNVERNHHLNCNLSKPIRVRELDWRHDFPPTTELEQSTQWSWTKDDVQVMESCDTIIAADVIYDEQITDSLFTVLTKLLSGPMSTRTVYLSLERRLNFTLSSLDVSCPAYVHFIEKCDGLRQNGWIINQLPLDFPQYFSYTRSKYLELWKISPVKQGS